MVTDQYFFDPSVRAAVKFIKENRIGRINTIIVRDQRFFEHGGWRTDKDQMGGGALIDGGIHFLDTLLNFGGNYESIHGKSIHGGSILNGEDNTAALFKFENGTYGLFFYSWSYGNPPELPAFEIIGEKGSIYEDVKSRTSWEVGTPVRTVYGDLILNGENANVKKYDVYTAEIMEFAIFIYYSYVIYCSNSIIRYVFAIVILKNIATIICIAGNVGHRKIYGVISSGNACKCKV